MLLATLGIHLVKGKRHTQKSLFLLLSYFPVLTQVRCSYKVKEQMIPYVEEASVTSLPQ